jgi:molybdenum cofactor synthesis domain-containing protein
MKISSLNISKETGQIKAVESLELDKSGTINNASNGNRHSEVSILRSESIEKFSEETGRAIKPGEFGENIIVQGLELQKIHPLDKFFCEGVQLEVARIGKKCRACNCDIFMETGKCLMATEGIFCRVLKGSTLKAGDELSFRPKEFKILVLTLSDRCYSGIYEDTSGPMVVEKIRSLMEANERKSKIEKVILPDEPILILDKMSEAFESGCDILITTGSTGLGPRDIAPETIKPLLDKEIPGIMEMIRMKYGQEKPNALLSRALAGTKSKTLVFAIPGSLKAVSEYMEEINKIIFHSFYMLHAIDHP